MAVPVTTRRPPRWHWGEPTAPLLRLVQRGGVLAIPSESSYGLGVDPRNPEGVAAVCALKGRSAGKALPVVAADLAQLAQLGIDLEDPGLRRVAGLWPAALTVVVPVRGSMPAALGGSTLGVRLPAHERLRVLLAGLGCALTATSANPEGAAPILDPDALEDLLAGADAMIVDDGPLPGGAPSTLVEWAATGWRILRVGAFEVERLGEGSQGVRAPAATEPINGDDDA